MPKTSSKRVSDSDSSSSSECQDSNFEPSVHRKARTRGNKNFQKNYPKNILISIITALDKIGAQKVSNDCEIEATKIQERNSASLYELYKILTHQHMKHINKRCIEILASNILLQNSKISKKAFHLEVLRDVFSFNQDVSLAQFKLQMKKKASKNCAKHTSDIEIFQYQSSTIFLLTKFCKIIEKYPNRSESLEKIEGTTQQSKSISKHEDLTEKSNKKNNRQLLKPLISDLCLKLNKLDPNKERLNKINSLMRKQILSTGMKIKEKLNLEKGIPQMSNFIQDVVEKCFKLISGNKKINFVELNRLIKIFDDQSLNKIIDEEYLSNKSQKQMDSQMDQENACTMAANSQDSINRKKTVILVQNGQRLMRWSVR